MTDDEIREAAEGCVMSWGGSDNPVCERMAKVAARLLDLLPPADDGKKSWAWVYSVATPESREKSGRINLTGPGGAVAATVFTAPDGHGFNWYVWDRYGVGGENDQESTIDEAVQEAELAARRWGEFTFTEPK